MKALSILAACALVSGTVAANASSYVVTIEQVGADVVATGSGNIDLTDLTLSTLTPTFSAGMNPPEAVITLNSGSSLTEYKGTFSGPPFGVLGPGFGPGIGIPHPGFEFANSATGNFVSFNLISDAVIVFPGYTSNDPLGTSTDTWDNATFTSLGLTAGTYEWTWGTGADQGSFTLNVGPVAATPLPAALPLFATGLGALGLLGWRRKRKAQAVAA